MAEKLDPIRRGDVRKISQMEKVDKKQSGRMSHTEISYIWKRKMTTWFQRWDVNGDGKLTKKDFEILADRLEQKCRKANARIRNVFIFLWENFVSPDEPSHIGVVTLDDWLRIHSRSRLEWDKNPTIAASLVGTFGLLFDVIDVDGNGSVSQDEYRIFFNIMGIDEDMAPEAFNHMDINLDGNISRDEFLNTVMSYYCDISPTTEELTHSLWLGPLTENDQSTASENLSVGRYSNQMGSV